MPRHWLKWSIVCISLALIIGLSIPGFALYQLLIQPMPITTSEPIIIVLDKAATASSFVHDLKTRHLIASEHLFSRLIRSQGYTSQLKAGIYQIQIGESALQFLRRVVAGDVLVEAFRIISGTTLRQVSANLEQAPYLNYNRADWLPIAEQHFSAEGLLLADTYYYDAGSQSKVVLARANKDLLAFLDVCWQQRDKDLPYESAYELLIAASILEKEASLPNERRLISGVIANRLHKHMRLQMDPTVVYAMGPDYQGKLTHNDLQIASPYNTYRNNGLPPTPIAMVGKDALDAVAHPTHTDYLYFVAKGDGSHQFSSTYEQQKQAITRYRRKP